MDKEYGIFMWNLQRELDNINKHGIDFNLARKVFEDNKRKIFIDSLHSKEEERYFCIGKVGMRIITVRFVYREGKIRIFGAGNWRKARKYYEKK